MRTLLHLLTLVCLLWCALGIAEPASAHGHVAGQVDVPDSRSIDAPDADGDAVPDRAFHQQCPAAPDVPRGALPAPARIAAVSPTPPRHETLTSLTRAPPLQPPSA